MNIDILFQKLHATHIVSNIHLILLYNSWSFDFEVHKYRGEIEVDGRMQTWNIIRYKPHELMINLLCLLLYNMFNYENMFYNDPNFYTHSSNGYIRVISKQMCNSIKIKTLYITWLTSGLQQNLYMKIKQ